MQVPEHLCNYIDYEAYGRNVSLKKSGWFSNLGYVHDAGDCFHECYDGKCGSIPEEHAAKQEIYDNLMVECISGLYEKLDALG